MLSQAWPSSRRTLRALSSRSSSTAALAWTAIDRQARARELTLTVLDIAVKKVVPVLIAMI